MATDPKKIEDGCLLALRYFGIFKYPLTVKEIQEFNYYPASISEVEDIIANLTSKGIVFRKEDYYLTENNDDWVREREEGYNRAIILLAKSKKYISVIASFPFVRGIAISGSLSKFHASAKPDIDYFIITAENRLWIARTLLHLYKKLTFLTGRQHYYCMNYFVDTAAMKIGHPNMYSSTEIVTLLPAYNAPLIRQFFTNNTWIREYLPNHPGQKNFDFVIGERKHRGKKFLELVLNLFFPRQMNKMWMKLTDRKWRRKWKRHGYSRDDYERAFYTTVHVSKNHPVDYEKKVLELLAQYQIAEGLNR